MSSRTFFVGLFWTTLIGDSGCLGQLVNFDEIKKEMAMEITALRYMLSYDRGIERIPC